MDGEVTIGEALSGLDWGTTAPQIAVEAPSGARTDLDGLDVSVQGVPERPAKARRIRRKRGPTTRQVVGAASAKEASEGVRTASPRARRGKDTPVDVLIQAGESPAVQALFDVMWREVGSRLAKQIGRSKASRQDVAVGWYMLLLAMRDRDAQR